MPPKVSVHLFEPTDFTGAHLMVAFPSVGLVAQMAANYLIERLELRQVGMLDSPAFPTISVVENGTPLNPARIYSGTYERRGKDQPIAVILSEFSPKPELVRPLAEAILAWAGKEGISTIVSPEGHMVEDELAFDNVVELFTAGSTQASRDLLEKTGATLMDQGIVNGVTGVLLNLGKRDRQDVIAILSEANPDFPDGRSAATMLDLLAQLVGVQLDTSDLYDDAVAFEKHVLESRRRRALQEGKSPTAASHMYG